jgi:hypothetical protein
MGLVVMTNKECFLNLASKLALKESIVNKPLVLKTMLFSNWRLLKAQTTQKVRLDLNS